MQSFKMVGALGLILLLGNPLAAMVVGSKKFTENVILGELISQLLQDQGLDPTHKKELGGTRILWEALIRGDIHIYPEYTGTISHEILRQPQAKSIVELRQKLAQYNIGLTAPLGFNNTYAIGVRKQQANDLNLRRISDLVSHDQLKFGFGHEFLDRQDGWPGLRQTYGLMPKNIKGMDHDIAYKAIASKAIDVIDLYTTDAEIQHYELVALKDDKKFFPEYKAVYLYRLDLPTEIIQTIKKLEGKVDEDTMIQLNSASKIGQQPAQVVANDFLKNEFGVNVSTQDQSVYKQILARTKEHLVLVGVSMLFAVVFSIPLGYFCWQSHVIRKIILPAVGVIQTVPSLALLVVMIPLFGIGQLPALIALLLYSLLPIVRGTYFGFTSINNELYESAQAMGLPWTTQLRKIYWPLAIPAVLNGIKTSAVINVGTATLGALIGAGGYGQTILMGIRLDDLELILAGAIPAALLAVLVQSMFDLLERAVVSRGLRANPQS